jgi:hypothetical protein
MAIQMQFCFESIKKILEGDKAAAHHVIDLYACGFAIPWKYLLIEKLIICFGIKIH